jgi:hypothetical protein
MTRYLMMPMTSLAYCANKSSKISGLPSIEESIRMYDRAVNGIHICRGNWRPMFGSEHVVWVSPPWKSQEYLYIDFPEAIFIDDALLYLGHINSRFPARYCYQLPNASWIETGSAVQYERKLGDEISFGGEVKLKGTDAVTLRIWIENKSDETLKNIKLQTCSFLYPIKEFSQMTNASKFIHHAGLGWITLEHAQKNSHKISANGSYRVGWRSGPEIADLPLIIAQSRDKSHYVAMTWFENTYSLIGNENHPCFHADPFFEDIAPARTGQINGEMVFFEGSFTDFLEELRTVYPEMGI